MPLRIVPMPRTLRINLLDERVRALLAHALLTGDAETVVVCENALLGEAVCRRRCEILTAPDLAGAA